MTLVADLLAAGRTLSVEFFPPRTDEGVAQLRSTVAELAPADLSFVSVTYGAGGTTRDRTAQASAMLKNEFGFTVMPHLTCVGHSRAELGAAADQLHQKPRDAVGRGGEFFRRLRQTDGASGFLCRNESPHDAFGAGHAGTALSAALGMATARDLRGTNEHVVAVCGDAGVGVVTEDFPGFTAWNPRLPELPGLSSPPKVSEIYRALAQAYPKAVLAQYTTLLDGTQIYFYALMKKEAAPSEATAREWAVAAERAVGFPASEANYTYYLAPGSQHCILPRPELYTLKVGEVSFLDWLRALAEGRTPPRVRP